MGGAAFSGAAKQAEAQQTEGSAVHLRIARFWRGEGRTLLQGVVGVPMAQSVRSVDVTVRDSTGKVLLTEAWTDSANAQAAALAGRAEAATTLEMLLDPGLYNVVVHTSEGASSDSTRMAVRGFAAAPVMSDVIVSASMRVLAENEKPLSAEMQRGRYAIERGATVTVLPSTPRLWYYVELYRQGADSVAQLELQVLRQNADTPLVRITRNVQVNPRGTVDAAAVVVQGLPPGDYRLRVKASSGGREETRESTFRMASIQTAPLAAGPSANATEASIFERYFTLAARSDAEINQIVDAMTVGTPGERVTNETLGLSPDAKRRFLARYWARLPDPNTATPNHELVDEYLQRVAYVQREFREGGRAGRSGVRTDRGRIYLKWGAPDQINELQISGTNRVVQIWKYTIRQALKYAFLDESGFRTYNLVFTTDRTERLLPDWAERVGDSETVRTILNY